MFGSSKKNNRSADTAAPSAEPEKPAAYDPESEAMFHGMPTVFKSQHHESTRARKTGMLILASGAGLILLASGLLAYYWLKPPMAAQRQPSASLSTTTDSSADADVARTETPADVPPVATTAPLQASLETSASTSVSSGDASSSVPAIQDVVEEPAASVPAVIEMAADSDLDGLSDDEEALLGTDAMKSDSDSDSFSDAVEVAKGFNPAGNGRLGANAGLNNFDNINFTILYPAGWTPKASANDQVVFMASDKQMIQVSMQPNIKDMTIVDWYRQQFGVTAIDSDKSISQKDVDGSLAWTGVIGQDGLNYYLMDALRQNIVTISYNLGPSNKKRFETLFKAIVNSFKAKY